MIDNREEQLQRVVNRLRKVVEDYSAQVIENEIGQICFLFEDIATTKDSVSFSLLCIDK